MSWDRVIQDSDEDEPLGDDGVEADALIDPHQGSESPKQQLPENSILHGDEQQAIYPIEHQAAQEVGAGSDLGVNFDQFLQSQEMSQSAVTLSQRRREERWIPSTGDGGGGSIGAMMTEIGHAQRRLLDDDASTGGQFLPSTATPYPSEISQPGSFPSIPNYPYQQVDEVAYENYTYTRPLVEDSYEVTQLVAPAHANSYEYSTPATLNNVESPFDPNDRAATFSTSVQLNGGVYANHPPKTVQRSRSIQSQPWSPHDTEPLSSVVSPGVSRSKSDNARSGITSPQHSEGSAHDELALPIVAPTTPADSSAVIKKRGRPKKQSLPEDDEEDELAAPRNYFTYEFSKANDKRTRDPSPKEQAVEMDVIGINDDADEPATNEVKPHHVPGLMVVLPVAFDGKSKRNDASGSNESGKAATKAPKKKKVKRSKTASAVLDKPNAVDVDDDVVWLDSNPLQLDENKTAEQTDEPQRAQDAPPEGISDIPPVEEDSGPKKRGRKRKKTAEVAPVAEEQQQPPETENAASHNAPITEDNPVPIPEPENEIAEPTKETSQPSKQESSTTTPDLPPQTPHRPEGKENDPATSKGSHKGPTKHSPILSTTKVLYRVGLSKRARIAPLLKIVRK